MVSGKHADRSKETHWAEYNKREKEGRRDAAYKLGVHTEPSTTCGIQVGCSIDKYKGQSNGN